MTLDLSEFSDRKNQRKALKNLNIEDRVNIVNHIWDIFVHQKPYIFLKYGLYETDEVWLYSSKEKIVKDRVCSLQNLWLPDKEYIYSSYQVEMNIGDEVSVKKFCKEVLNSKQFKNGSSEIQISYLDVLERFCYNFPSQVFTSIMDYAPSWLMVFVMSKRPNYIKGVGPKFTEELNGLLSFLFENSLKIGFISSQELLEAYSKVNPKNFKGDGRCSALINYNGNRFNLSFIESIEEVQKKKEVNSDALVILDGTYRIFLFRSDLVFIKLNNILVNTDVLNYFLTFTNIILNYKGGDFKEKYPFLKVTKNDLKVKEKGVFSLSVSLMDNLSDQEFLEKMQNLIIYFIECIFEKNRLNLKTLDDVIKHLIYKNEKNEENMALFNHLKSIEIEHDSTVNSDDSSNDLFKL